MGRVYYQKQTVDRLKPLAAHIVIMGQEVSSGSIGGLDMVEAKDGQDARLLGSQEIHALYEASAQIRSGIAELLFKT